MTMIRCFLLGLIFVFASGLAVATPPGANTVIVGSVEQPIGIVAFDGRDGSRVTKVLRDSLSKRSSTGSEREIRLIDRRTFDEAVKKTGSEAKAAQTLGVKLGLEFVTFGSVEFSIDEEFTIPNEEICAKNEKMETCNKIRKKTISCIKNRNVIHFKIDVFQINGSNLSQFQMKTVSIDSIHCKFDIVEINSSDSSISVLVKRESDQVNKNLESFDLKLLNNSIVQLLSKLEDFINSNMDVSILSKEIIEGSTEISAKSNAVITSALGNGSIATTDIGSVSISKIRGNANIKATSKNTRLGDVISDSISQTEIESIGNYKKNNGTSISSSIGISSGKNITNPEAMSEPPFFPWPPPRPSLFGEISSNFDVSEDLADIDRQIRAHLVKRSYESLHYFGVVGGFVVTTDLERITTDGQPAKNDRWLIGKSGRTSSFTEYIKNLIFGEKGRFRMFAFVVSDREPGAAPYLATEQDTVRMKTNGAMMLSARTGAIETSSSTRIWLYVYEFESALNKTDTIVALIDNVVPLAAHKRSLGLK